MRLKRSPYGSRDAARIWHDLLADQFYRTGLQKLKSAPCVLRTSNKYKICCVEDLLVFAETLNDIEEMKDSLRGKFMQNDLGEP